METLQLFFKNAKLKEELHYMGLLKVPIVAFFLLVATAMYSQSNLIINATTLKVGSNMVLITNNAKLNTSGVFKILGNGLLKVDGNFTNNSGISDDVNGGKVVFTGSSNSTVTGANPISFNNFEINKSLTTNEVNLGVDIDIVGNLLMTSGDLDVRNTTVSLGTTGNVVDETNNNRIKSTYDGGSDVGFGKIVATRTLINGLNTNVAGLGVNITSSVYTGAKVITRYLLYSHSDIDYFVCLYESCLYNRSFYLPGFGAEGVGHSVDVGYFDEELFECVDLPLEFEQPNQRHGNAFLSFDASKNSESVDLKWTVFGVFDMTRFELEASYDNDFYYPLSDFTELGNANKVNIFEYKDIEGNRESKFKYYRINQFNTDGKVIIHGPIEVSFDDPNHFKTYFSNNGTLNVEFFAPEAGEFTFKFLNSNGQIIFSSLLNAHENFNNQLIELPKISDGIYLVNLYNGDKFYSQKIVKILK